ncbi:MAG: cysteine--tRNA ligase [Deltaproteobacteria bacterium RIFOXYA12_FULL_58_15]|nr:MAG: cysteine--tRNA ligase [Deltaproteobacteria bacterium RIFOXYA12_FULL_58_15]
MTLHIYDTMAGQKRPFTPLEPGKVGIYVCGPTVYDMSHVGHARVYVAFDTIVRYLRRKFTVNYVRNYTDVDDKIIKRAREHNEEPGVLAQRFISEFEADMQSLGVAPANLQPRVTDHIKEIVDLVERLIKSGAAYPVDGDVYFSIEKFPTYGRLGRRRIDDMEAGARVEVDMKKHHPMDFALWKAAKPGEPFWDSPWGKGRPGWHIECSAMSAKHLAESFDIHGGGKDLIFPHHENEIAQSEAASGKTLANYWMHNGFVNIDNEKMSKSLDNFFTVREVLEKFDAQALRYFLLTTHYRSPINFSDQSVREAEARVKYLYETLARMDATITDGPTAGTYREAWVGDLVAGFEATMDDDFNTAKVIGDLSEAFSLVNDILDHPKDKDTDARTLRALRTAITEIGSVLGLFTDNPAVVLERLSSRRQKDAGVDPLAVEDLIAERAAARKAKDFARADAVRNELAAMGVVIKDSPQGTTWEMA